MSKKLRIILASLAGIILVALISVGFQARWILWYAFRETPLCLTDARCWEWKCQQYPDARGCVTTIPQQ